MRRAGKNNCRRPRIASQKMPTTSSGTGATRGTWTLHGQEKNLGTWAICKMNMLLHGLPDARIEKGDDPGPEAGR